VVQSLPRRCARQQGRIGVPVGSVWPYQGRTVRLNIGGTVSGRAVDRFVSNVTNRLDAKGRVSIPSSFRQVLARDGFDGLFIYPALDIAALDAGGHALLGEIDRMLDSEAPGSHGRDHLATALLGVSDVLKIDPEGRVQLTDSLKDAAGLTDHVTFVGLGNKFQLWQPDRFAEHLASARARLREVRR
jgi:MraZ protein